MPTTITGINMGSAAANAASSVFSAATIAISGVLSNAIANNPPPNLNQALGLLTSSAAPVQFGGILGVVQQATTQAITNVKAGIETAIINTKFDALVGSGIQQIGKKQLELLQASRNNVSGQFISDNPELLFVSEYIVNNTFCGVLVVWKQYKNASHYEVYKKNVFQENSEFERMLFLDTQSLDEEKKYFVNYIQNTLGFTSLDMDNVYVILDDDVKEDRIYQYCVVAASVPNNTSEIFFDLILQSNGLLTTVDLDSSSKTTIFDFAGVNLGSQDLAWIISLVNSNLLFFGRIPLEQPVSSFLRGTNNFSVNVPQDINDTMNIIQQCMSTFDIRDFFDKFLNELGNLPQNFKAMFLNSLDQNKKTFSYDTFRSLIINQVPVFNLLFTVASSKDVPNAVKELSALSIIVPMNTGTERLSSVESLSKIFKFVNQTLVSVLYAQEQDIFLRVSNILAQVVVNSSTATQNTFNSAISRIGSNVGNNLTNSSTTTGLYSGITSVVTPASNNNGATSHPLIRVI